MNKEFYHRAKNMKKIMRGMIFFALTVLLIFINGNTSYASSSGDEWEGMTIHSTKVYDKLSNKGGYVRPSTQTILNDYKQSSQYGQHPRIMLTKDSVKELCTVVGTKGNAGISSDLRYDLWNNPNTGVFARARQLCNQLTGADQESYLFGYTKCYETRMPGPAKGGLAADVFKNRMMLLGIAYQLTGNTMYPEAAWVMLERVVNFKDINPWHDLDFGYFCQGYAIAYDWMYDAWSTQQREILEEAMKRQCFRPANEAYYNNSINRSQTAENASIRGVYVNHNHNSFVNSGIAMVSLALLDRYPNV